MKMRFLSTDTSSPTNANSIRPCQAKTSCAVGLCFVVTFVTLLFADVHISAAQDGSTVIQTDGSRPAREGLSVPSNPGLSVGVDMFSMDNQVAASMQVGLPISRLVSIVFRPMLLGGQVSSDLDAGGRIEVQLQSPVYMDRLRAYFGAGPQGFYEIRGANLHGHDFSGGWDGGLELFLNDRFAFHWEMGTSGGGVSGGAGPAFAIGVRMYPRRGSALRQ